MNNKIYICDCGKEFSNGTSLGNHKRMCPIYHMNKYGTLEHLNNFIHKREQSKIEYKQSKLQQWISEQHTCKNCGKVMTEFFGSGIYCSRSCANSREHTEESRKKTSNSLHKTIKLKRIALGLSETQEQRFCAICDCPIDINNKSGYCLNCLRYSPELFEYRSKHSKYAQSFVTSNVHWKPRNETPYSEIFWKHVLDNNNIKYEHDYTIHIDNKHWYYADFYIEKNGKFIDLEIDGKRHKYEDRKQHDLLRDQYLKNHGYIVYRIDWNNMSKDAGKLEMMQKIQKFLKFYSEL